MTIGGTTPRAPGGCKWAGRWLAAPAALLIALGAGASAADVTGIPAGMTPAAARVDLVLFPAQAVNLDPEAAEALGAAVYAALTAALPDLKVAAPARAGTALATTGTPAAAAAALGADLWITCRAMRLEGRTEVALTRHRPGMRPVVIRAPWPAEADVTVAAGAWVAELLAAPDPAPAPPLPADARSLDRLTWGLRAGPVWATDASIPLVALEAEAHSRSGRWFMAGAVGGRLPLDTDPGARYWLASARLRSGIYGGSGPVWPSIWLGIEPRLVVGEGGGQLGVMPVIGVGLDLLDLGPARVSVDAEVGYNLIHFAEASPVASDEEAVGAEAPDGPQPIEIGLMLGVSW